MLNVAGAGVHRMERYGKRFLNAIAKFIQAHPKVTKRSASTTENRAQKPEFYLTLEDAENFVYKDHCFISEIRVDLILFALLMIQKKCVFEVTHFFIFSPGLSVTAPLLVYPWFIESFSVLGT